MRSNATDKLKSSQEIGSVCRPEPLVTQQLQVVDIIQTKKLITPFFCNNLSVKNHWWNLIIYETSVWSVFFYLTLKKSHTYDGIYLNV